jgi:hypothetical protein
MRPHNSVIFWAPFTVFSSAHVSVNTSVGQFSILSFPWQYKILNTQKKELLKKILALKLVHAFSEFYQENAEESLACELNHMNLLFLLGAFRVRCFNSSFPPIHS